MAYLEWKGRALRAFGGSRDLHARRRRDRCAPVDRRIAGFHPESRFPIPDFRP
jgi:hypothetical protein